MLQELFDIQNQLTEEDKFEIWLDSEGGDCDVAEGLRLIFESYEESKFQLVACGFLESSALNIFVSTNCRKKVVPGTIGLFHTISVTRSFNNKGKSRMEPSRERVYTDFYFPSVEEAEEELLKYLSEDDTERYNNNEDVYIGTEVLEKF